MLRNITWSNYLIALGALTAIWYICLVLRYHHKKLFEMLSGKRRITFPFKRKESTKEHISDSKIGNSFREPFSTMEDAEELTEILKKAVAESSDRNLSIDEMKNYLRLILNEYPYVKISSLRHNMNNIVVAELEKYPKLTISILEVDSLWEELL